MLQVVKKNNRNDEIISLSKMCTSSVFSFFISFGSCDIKEQTTNVILKMAFNMIGRTNDYLNCFSE